MTMSRTDLIHYANTFGLSLSDDTPHSLVLIVVGALDNRASKGLSSPDQIERLIGLGYNPDLVLSLSWAHANEALRLLTADTVRTTEEPL